MADAETCQLNDSHPPKPAATKSFEQLLPEIKRQLIHLRHTHDKHEPQYFSAVSSLSDDDLGAFESSDLVAVRAGTVAYGIIIFGKVKIPKAKGSYIFVRWIEQADEPKFHSIYTEEKDESDGTKSFRAIMGEKDELLFFNE